MKKLFGAALFIALVVLACQKEVSLDNIPSPTPNATVTATVVGRIVDESGAPVQGAQVKAGTSTAQTNINGEFRVSNTTLSEKTAFVSVEKNGYFTGSRTFVARAGQKHYVEIQLLPKNLAGSINAATGGTITLVNGSTLTLPAAGVVSKNSGAAYTGTVQVAMAWIDPTSANLMRQMPGDLRGISEANTEVGLQSFGMLAVELSSPNGQALQIASGKKASLQFPLPNSVSGAAPATIALWSFNDSTGLWKQEGTATKSGNVYKAEVSHFSFWNCDAPFPAVNFSARLVNQNGQPLQHTMVKIKRPSVANSWAGTGWTDSIGGISGLVPANEVLTIEVYNTFSCSQATYTQNIGPFSTATDLGTITITNPATNYFSISALIVNCSNAPVTSGYVEINTGYSVFRAPINSGGSITATIPSCGVAQTITYYAMDSTNNQQSAPVTTTINNFTSDLGTITACGLSTQRFINFTLDGTNYSITSPSDSTTGRNSLNLGGTTIDGFKTVSANMHVSFRTGIIGGSIGTFPIKYLVINTPSFNDSLYVPQTGINAIFTEYGSVGAFIGGSFSGVFNGNNATHTVQCTFRVRQD